MVKDVAGRNFSKYSEVQAILQSFLPTYTVSIEFTFTYVFVSTNEGFGLLLISHMAKHTYQASCLWQYIPL